MATIVRFAKYSIPKFVPKKYMNYDSSLLRRTFDSYKRNFCSQGVVDSFTDYDNEVSTYDNSKPSRRTPISANNNFSDFSATESSDNSVLKLQDGNHKYKYFAAYLLAKKLGEVESPESFVSPLDKKNGKVNDNLVKIPLACLHFNNGQFPNERSLVNWIKAIDFGLEQKYITSFGLSIAIWAFAKIVGKPSNSDKKLLSVVGFDRLTTWFAYALEKNDNITHVYCRSIYNCVVAADSLAKHHAFRKWNLRSLYGLLNYSLSIYITQRLKYVESLNVDEKFQKFSADILRLIICIEVGLDQPCLLEEETKEEVVNLAVQCFRYYAQLMDESESISIRDERLFLLCKDEIALLFCRWHVNNLPFWHDWFEFMLNRGLEIDEDPVLVFKQLQLVLFVLLKSNVDPNFLRNDANFAKYLAEKIKPLFIEHFRADGLRFVTRSESEILKRLVVDCLEASESPFFTNEELNKIFNCLNNRKECHDQRW